jgi:hypothetical protein
VGQTATAGYLRKPGEGGVLESLGNGLATESLQKSTVTRSVKHYFDGLVERSLKHRLASAPNLGAAVQAIRQSDDTIQIRIEKTKNETFAVRPALVLFDIAGSLGSQELANELYWREFDPVKLPLDRRI